MPAVKVNPSISNLIYCGFDFCALVLGIVVLINYFISKKINNRTSYLFRALIISTLVSTTLNIVAIVAISVTGCGDWLRYLLTLSNYIAYNATGTVFLIYSLSLIYENRKLPRFCYIAVGVLVLATFTGLVLACVSLYFPQDIKAIYEGFIYGCQFCALALSLAVTFVNRRLLTRVQSANVYFFTVVNMIATLVQLIWRMQVGNFALMLATLLIFVTLERPEDAIDAVSGAFNLKTFTGRGNILLNSGTTFWVFMTEINNMALINSSFGIQNGNLIIKEIAERLKKAIGKNLNLYRLGGVRFAVIFNSRSEFDAFSQRFTKLFVLPFAVDGTQVHLSATSCIIEMPRVTAKLSEVEDLIRYYRTSINSSESIIEADGESLAKARRREIVDFAIQNAIKNNTFEVYYQPIFSVKENAFTGCEALIRLKDPELGYISPDEFIPIAEQNGKIIEVGRFVIEEVCRFINRYDPAEYGLKFVDVNLSVIQCMHPEIIKNIEETLEKYGVPRSMVNLEITETASAQSYAMLQTRLNELHSNGFTISLDDFGTGFASVEYLINYPFDVVKLDKSLVWAYMSTKKYEPILQHYMPMLHSLGAEIVAEGVETVEMVRALKALGCDFLQGYYYSKPIPKDAFVRFLQENGGVKTA